ncbi:MAG: hypothetical protein K0R50_3759 [Eubacterium sp.]|nr:hypothetical protein [Eubacterium sp.]
MFTKILKKDLKRKKAMNIILFLFIIIASMLIASSANLLYTTTTALESFKRLSNTSDNMIITISSPENDKQIREWSSKFSKIKSITSDDMILVSADNITVPSKSGKLEDGATLAIARIPKKK